MRISAIGATAMAPKQYDFSDEAAAVYFYIIARHALTVRPKFDPSSSVPPLITALTLRPEVC